MSKPTEALKKYSYADLCDIEMEAALAMQSAERTHDQQTFKKIWRLKQEVHNEKMRRLNELSKNI